MMCISYSLISKPTNLLVYILTVAMNLWMPEKLWSHKTEFKSTAWSEFVSVDRPDDMNLGAAPIPMDRVAFFVDAPTGGIFSTYILCEYGHLFIFLISIPTQ